MRIPRNPPPHFRKEEALASAKEEERSKSADEVSKQSLVHVRLDHQIMMIQSDPVNFICPLLKVKAAKREKQMRASLDTHKRHLALLDAQASPEAQLHKCSALSLAFLSPCNPLIQEHIQGLV